LTTRRIAVVLFGPEGRGSFNEAGIGGVARARESGPAVPVHWSAPRDEHARADALAALCHDGVDFVVAHGGQGDAPVAAVAPHFPGVRFAITQGSVVAPNVTTYEVLQEHSAFLAGVLAGLASQTRVVGHLSGERVKPGLKGRAAFAHGVRAAAPDCRFVTHFCGNQHDPALGDATVRALHGEGADMVFAMIDGGREGVSSACRELGVRQIGNVLDWVARDPGVFAASAVADSGRCVAEAIDDFAAGRFAPTHREYGLERPDHVRLVIAAGCHERFGAEVEAWRHRVLAGVVVPDTNYTGPELHIAR
jgi:basic membrane protein A